MVVVVPLGNFMAFVCAGLGRAAGQVCQGLGHPVHLGPRALTADEIRGTESRHPFRPVSDPLPFRYSGHQAGRWQSGVSFLPPSIFRLLCLPRYRSVVDLVKSWSEEKRHYLFPAPKDCNPHCPWHCSGPVCSHYTQVPLCPDEGLMGEQILVSLGEKECSGTEITNKTEPPEDVLLHNKHVPGKLYVC